MATKIRWCCAALFPVCVAALVVGALVVTMGAPPARAEDANAELAFSGPYTHKNLSIYLIHGPDRIKLKEFLTLQEALDKEKAVVNETGSVNELTIESLADVTIYIHAGAIIKGGKQDRVIKDDYILLPRTKITIQVFCVEQGRWQGRGTESAARFSGNANTVSSKELKLAVRSSGKQGDVWQEVSRAQTQLSSNVGGDVRSKDSQTSLQLTLEDKKVQAASEEYRKALAEIGAEGKDVVGYAVVINGKINSVDVYGSHSLFAKLWPQLLGSTATEAVAKFEKDKTFSALAKDEVKSFMEDSRKARAEEQEITKGSKLLKRDSKDSASFTTVDEGDKSRPAAPVRENIINKE